MGVLTVSLAEKLTGQDAGQIQRLEASNRRLREVKDLSGCSKLARLDVSHNSLSCLGGIGECRALTWLDISHNQLESLASLQTLGHLSVLRASNSNLASCVDLSHLTSLKALILSHNQLSCLPGLPSLSQLNTLVISHNKFESVSIDNLKRLAKLSVSNNSLKIVPSTQHNPELRELRLNGNNIRRLPESLKFNAKLKIIDLGNNKLKTISVLEPVLRCLDELVNLNLKGNELCASPSYPQEVLGMVSSVKVLDGAKVDNLAALCEDARGAVSTEKSSKTTAGKTAETSSVKESFARREKRKRKRGATEVDGSVPIEDSTEKFPVKKKKKSCNRTGDGKDEKESVEIMKTKKKRRIPSTGVLSESLEKEFLASVSEVVKQSTTDSVLTGSIADELAARADGGQGHLSTPATSRELTGVRASLKRTLSRGRSGIVSVKEVRQGRKKKRWEASVTDGDNLIGSGKPSTWK